jgi:amino acid adenylation domain-containing protein
LERSIELIVGMLAILKAGGAFVPLDPAWPPDRLRMVAEDANLAAIVTRQRYEDRLSNKSLLVSMDQLLLTNELRRNQNPDVPVSPTALAYVLYTSGTTGQPKGVMVEHRQLLSYFWAVVDRLELRSDGVYAMLQPLTVDSCQTMIFPALGRGGTLCLISEERSLDAAALVEYFGHQQIDYLKIAPSHLAALLDHTPSVRLLPHRTLIVGGEAAHWDFVERLWALAPTCTIWNHYGPTETTVGVSVQRLAADADPLSPTVSIGRPLANVQFYILDPYQNPVPVGVPGELYIGGSQVAHGYLQRPDLTSERFIPDPFSGASAKRLYRTGDRARYLSDGSVEFLGRFDDQVKIRGYRVELGEIEVALGQHPLVQERVVIYREAGNGGYHLVGYVVAKALGPEAFGPEVLGSELERDLLTFLRTRLPSHMVPSAILVLEQLPRTRHGKLDRQALPVVESSRFNQSLTHTPPQTPLQKIIADVWRERLDLRQVGLHDNFFQLGGHSLLVIQVISELRKQLAIDLPVQLLFQSPTINELAESIELLRTLEQVRLVSVNGIDEEREEIQL